MVTTWGDGYAAGIPPPTPATVTCPSDSSASEPIRGSSASPPPPSEPPPAAVSSSTAPRTVGIIRAARRHHGTGVLDQLTWFDKRRPEGMGRLCPQGWTQSRGRRDRDRGAVKDRVTAGRVGLLSGRSNCCGHRRQQDLAVVACDPDRDGYLSLGRECRVRHDDTRLGAFDPLATRLRQVSFTHTWTVTVWAGSGRSKATVTRDSPPIPVQFWVRAPVLAGRRDERGRRPRRRRPGSHPTPWRGPVRARRAPRGDPPRQGPALPADRAQAVRSLD